MTPHPVPELEGDALAAVQHRGSNMQIIASAGSGKTEVVSQRVADLLADNLPPESIVAFTFTERAAKELKERIAQRTEQRLGRQALDRLNGLFVGTMHSYCFRLLQQHVPRYEAYDVLDDNQLAAFLAREGTRLEIKQFDDRGRTFASIEQFLRAIDIVENELLDVATLPEPLRSTVTAYYDTLERYRLLTFGMQIAKAVEELEAGLSGKVHQTLRHLIVDEYQDINPAQDRLIAALAGEHVEVCIVGDDQQAIYQWRGSDVKSITEFATRFAPVTTYTIEVNRRSRPSIIATANQFAESIPDRLDKTMVPDRAPATDGPEIAAWAADTEEDEAGHIANLVLDLIEDKKVEPQDIAVLVRSRAAYRRIVEQFETFDIPVAPGGRTGLFDQPEAVALGKMFCWLAGWDWREQYQRGQKVNGKQLVLELQAAFDLDDADRNVLARELRAWRDLIPSDKRQANLVGEFYAFLEILRVGDWDLDQPAHVSRLGVLARFTALLADYESVRRRARPDSENPGEQVGGQDRGTWYYKNLAALIVNYAQGAYEGFDGEKDFALNAVDLTTVHRAKGLEWPAVFVPSLTARRFPSSRTGQPGDWLIPRSLFDAPRYEGSDADERRLFYVAITRARDWLSLSRHERITRQSAKPSPYFNELAAWHTDVDTIAIPTVEGRTSKDEQHVELTYSELSSFLDCGAAFRLRNLFGFQPRLAPELGYGKAVHHLMRTVAEETQATGQVPSAARIDQLLDEHFFVPAANKPLHRQLKDAARRLVAAYADNHPDDLQRVWETERPFELHLDGVTISGRADVILDQEGGVATGLAIVDYKTSTSGDADQHALQLQVYAEAGRREGLDVRGGYVHDLKAQDRLTIPVDPSHGEAASKTVEEAAERIRERDYAPNPGVRCRSCEVRTICRHATR